MIKKAKNITTKISGKAESKHGHIGHQLGVNHGKIINGLLPNTCTSVTIGSILFTGTEEIKEYFTRRKPEEDGEKDKIY